MRIVFSLVTISFLVVTTSCKEQSETTNLNDKSPTKVDKQKPFDWKAANVYFLLTDRFHNGDTSNDVNFNRTKETAVLRGFEGGDLKGITEKINEGYFNDLGINAIWMTPIVEQIHGGTDEGTGFTYGYHGYWAKDWTTIDPNFGTPDDLKELVDSAHKNGIRILLDAVINHTGPVTEIDTVWPSEWVRTSPKCEFTTYENTTKCTLVENLPDIKTESDAAVELPPQLVEKWKSEGRYEEEVAELDEFFKNTELPRAPRFYIMKWLSDYITDYGIDGYRIDTVKHTEETVWQEFRTVCDAAFAEYKSSNPDKVLDNSGFYLVGEVYNYGISSGQDFNIGDRNVNYYENALDALINFDLKWNAAQQDLETTFSIYDSILNSDLKDYSILSYMTSHDDGQPFDKERIKNKETATALLLAPGASQVYYGDEMARDLTIEGTSGDATLRSSINWNDVTSNQEELAHWQKLGQFRNNHVAVGAGRHVKINDSPYTFSRIYSKNDVNDAVVIALNTAIGEKTITVGTVFENGTEVVDAYSNTVAKVENGKVVLDTEFDIVLLENN